MSTELQSNDINLISVLSDSAPKPIDTSFSEDSDDSVLDATYIQPTVNESDSDSVPNVNMSKVAEISNNFGETSTISTSPKKCIKRKKCEKNWKRNSKKYCRNSGKEYIMNTADEKIRIERKLQPPCTEKCKLKCSSKVTEMERMKIFTEYWNLGNIDRQRQFIHNSMEVIQPKYRYIREGGDRKKRDNNNAYYFIINDNKIRVCKIFFKNTLDINDRPIRTVQDKRNKVANVLLDSDKRGKHGKHRKIDEALKESAKNFINMIPKIESHYTRANTSKLFIDGSKTIADIHRDYIADCKEKNVAFVNYVIFYRIFKDDFNISFFSPKKDLCETCCAYENTENEEKKRKKEYYDQHLVEKELSRKEKKYDKEELIDTQVAVYDLQAVMQIPKGDVSVFYYKSKLNVFNFTIYDLKSNECECFVWDESNGHRGVNELGTCIKQYLERKAASSDTDIIFYSDNCAGQQKNKFMIALYLYAVTHLNIRSITHKYLIKGHTQNEGDSAHSLIERQVKRMLKGGPMYTPDSFISAIRAAKKTGTPFKVTELCFEDFLDIKMLVTDMGFNMSKLKINQIKILRVERESPSSIFYKNSYKDDQFQEINVRRKKTQENIKLGRAFLTRPKIAENKKQDLLQLIDKNCIPKYYKPFYDQL